MSWLDLIDKSEINPIPNKAELVSDNGVSRVWRGNDGWYYKRSIPYFVQNELAFINKLQFTGYVPDVFLHDKYTLKIEEIKRIELFSYGDIVGLVDHFIYTLEVKGIRHGDLTKPHVFMSYSDDGEIVLKVIDWAEARWKSDPAPDKRPEGDLYWMNRTIRELTK